jgi:uncharacterized membrane protein
MTASGPDWKPPPDSPFFEKERLAAMTDGVFAVAITLLVVDLAWRKNDADSSTSGLYPELARLLLFGASFLVIAIYWIAHHNEYQMLAKIRNRWAIWWNLLFLFPILLLPVPLGRVIISSHHDTADAIWIATLYYLDLAIAGLLLDRFFRYAAGPKNEWILTEHRKDIEKTHKRNLAPAFLYLASCFVAAFAAFGTPREHIPTAAVLVWVPAMLIPVGYIARQWRKA